MRRSLLLLIPIALMATILAGVGQAQDEPRPPAFLTADADGLPKAMIDGVADESFVRLSMQATLAMVADDPADSCQDAPNIALSPNFPADGISFNTRDATSVDSDPRLTCSWGTPQRRQGYRTVWYRLVVPFSGRIVLDTFSSHYDTVLGVFSTIVDDDEETDECDFLTLVHCSDDVNGFASEITFSASSGDVYYIEVADWQPGVPAPPILNFYALLQPINTLWTQIQAKPTTPAISRHSTVAYQDKLYVIGGQTGVPGEQGVPVVSNQLLRLDTYNNIWESMQVMPKGYSNTTAALVNDKIYVPSGYDGNDVGYDNLHWVYDIAVDAWSLAASIPSDILPNFTPFGWSASAVPPGEGRYYLMGGTTSVNLFDSDVSAMDEAYVFVAPKPDAADQGGAWLPVDPMPTARYGHTATWIPTNNLGACVTGGVSHQPGEEAFIFQTVTECYHPTRGWRNLADLNIPRLGAGSALGTDGKWYVFGGLTPILGVAVPALRSEVYDPVRNTWTILPPDYNVGGDDLRSARAFVSGSMVGNELTIVGGSIINEGETALPIAQRLTIPPTSVYLPISTYLGPDYLRPDDNFSQAKFIPFGLNMETNFSNQRDFYDFYTFTLPSPMTVRLKLGVPDDNDFNLYLYDHNKLEWGRSAQPFNGVDEEIELLLPAGQFFIEVERAFPTAQPNRGANYSLMILN